MSYSTEGLVFSLKSCNIFAVNDKVYTLLSGSLAEEELKAATMVDEINAYSYTYPLELSSTNFAFKW